MCRIIWIFDDWRCAFTYMDIMNYAMGLSYMLMMESVLWKLRMLRERRLIDSSLMKLIWVPLRNIVALLYKIFYIYASLSTKHAFRAWNLQTCILYARKRLHTLICSDLSLSILKFRAAFGFSQSKILATDIRDSSSFSLFSLARLKLYFKILRYVYVYPEVLGGSWIFLS